MNWAYFILFWSEARSTQQILIFAEQWKWRDHNISSEDPSCMNKSDDASMSMVHGQPDKPEETWILNRLLGLPFNLQSFGSLLEGLLLPLFLSMFWHSLFSSSHSSADEQLLFAITRHDDNTFNSTFILHNVWEGRGWCKGVGTILIVISKLQDQKSNRRKAERKGWTMRDGPWTRA